MYPFFLSYSHRDLSSEMIQFARQLRVAVQGRLGGKVEDAGFIDREQLKLGDPWPTDLAKALATAKVFVPVYSMDYFSSEFCGKEWRVFRLRRQQLPPGNWRVIPVLWGKPSVFNKVMPEPVKALQFDNGAFPNDYRERGLGELIRVPKEYEGIWQKSVEILADAIVDAAQLPPVPAGVPADFKQTLPDFPSAATTTQKSSIARFVYVVARRNEVAEFRKMLDAYGDEVFQWQPYHPDTDEVARVTQRISDELKLISVPVQLDDLANPPSADDGRTLVAVIVDAWAALIPRYNEYLQKIRDNRSKYCATVIVWNAQDDETLTRADDINKMLTAAVGPAPFISAAGTGFERATNSQELQNCLRGALEAARIRIMNSTPPTQPMPPGSAHPHISAAGT